MSPRAGQAGHPARTLAFVESPVQLLNVLEWAHLHGLRGPAEPGRPTAPRPAVPGPALPSGPVVSGPAVPPSRRGAAPDAPPGRGEAGGPADRKSVV